jgi:hypothetical protein
VLGRLSRPEERFNPGDALPASGSTCVVASPSSLPYPYQKGVTMTLGALKRLINGLPDDRSEAPVRVRYTDTMGTVQTVELRSAIEEVPLGNEQNRAIILIIGAASQS